MIGEIIMLLLFGSMTRSIFLGFPSSDHHVHLWLLSRFQRGQSFADFRVRDGLYSGVSGNPPLPYWLYAKVPEKWLFIVSVVCNLLFDMASILLVYSLLLHYLPSGPVPGLPVTPACMGALIYATTPLLHPFASRLLGMGSRTLGTLVSSAYFMALGGYLSSEVQSWPMLGLLFLLTAIIMFSSKFCLQVLVFTSIGLSIFLLDFRPVVLISCFLAVLVLIPGLNVRTYLWTRFSHMRWYMKAIKHETMRLQLTTLYRGSISVVRELPTMIRQNPIHGIWVLVVHITPVVLMYSVPALIWFAALAFGVGNDMVSQYPFVYGTALVLSCFSIFVVTSIRPWIVFGAAERYMEAALPFLSLLIVGLTPPESIANLWLLLLLNIFFVLFIHSFQSRQAIVDKFQLASDANFNELVNYLEGAEEHMRIITAPIKTANALAYHVKRECNYYFLLHHDEVGLDFMFQHNYNLFMFALDFEKAKKKMGADTFVLDRSYTGRYAGAGLLQRLDDAELVFENDRYQVFRI